jgi:hypothetical protein
MDNRYQKAVYNIINIQKQIIGPLALDMARRVANISVGKNGEVEILGDPLTVMHQLVKEYEVLFGELSVKVSRDSIKDMKFEPTELPEILR